MSIFCVCCHNQIGKNDSYVMERKREATVFFCSAECVNNYDMEHKFLLDGFQLTRDNCQKAELEGIKRELHQAKDVQHIMNHTMDTFRGGAVSS